MRLIWNPGTQESERNLCCGYVGMELSSYSFDRQPSRREIQQKGIRQAESFQIRSKNGEVNLLQRCGRLEFQYDPFLNQEVDAMFSSGLSTIKNWNWLLSLKPNPQVP